MLVCRCSAVRPPHFLEPPFIVGDRYLYAWEYVGGQRVMRRFLRPDAPRIDWWQPPPRPSALDNPAEARREHFDRVEDRSEMWEGPERLLADPY